MLTYQNYANKFVISALLFSMYFRKDDFDLYPLAVLTTGVQIFQKLLAANNLRPICDNTSSHSENTPFWASLQSLSLREKNRKLPRPRRGLFLVRKRQKLAFASELNRKRKGPLARNFLFFEPSSGSLSEAKRIRSGEAGVICETHQMPERSEGNPSLKRDLADYLLQSN